MYSSCCRADFSPTPIFHLVRGRRRRRHHFRALSDILTSCQVDDGEGQDGRGGERERGREGGREGRALLSTLNATTPFSFTTCNFESHLVATLSVGTCVNPKCHVQPSRLLENRHFLPQTSVVSDFCAHFSDLGGLSIILILFPTCALFRRSS